MFIVVVVVRVYNVLPRWLHSVLVCTRSLTEMLEVLLAVVVVLVRVLVLMYKVVVEARLFFWLLLPLQIVVVVLCLSLPRVETLGACL